MSDFNSNAPVQNQYSMANPPGSQYQPLDPSARPFMGSMSGYQPSFSYEPPNFLANYPGQFESPAANGPSLGPNLNSSAQQQHGRVPQYPRFQPHPPYRHSAHGFYSHPGGSNPQQRGPHGSDSSRSFHQQSGAGSHFSDFGQSRNDMDLPPMMHPLNQASQMYGLPPYNPISSGPPHGFGNFSSRVTSQSNQCPAPPHSAFPFEPMQPMRPNRAAPGAHARSPSEQTRHLTSPSRRTSYERQHQTGNGPERRPQSFINAQPRRSDRSVSPRTSNRRSFDRYATDLPSSSSSSEEAEAANRFRATPQHRFSEAARRRQIQAREFRRTVYMQEDPNIPSAAQMQVLRDKLRHFLPNELPEGAAAMCDICQKDYSTKHVNPSEEEEVAIQLPCKHVFGEHCINTWFETCKTHKNKITCPMCRKLLIEPRRSTLSAASAAELMNFMEHPAFSSLPAEEQAMMQRFRGAFGPEVNLPQL